MFFGLEVKSKQKQSKPMTLTNSVHLSQAVLLPDITKKDPVCLWVEHDKKEFVLCVLDPTKSWQSPLNLMFGSGSEVRFFLRGSGTVHLTGFESFDDLDDISMSMSEDEEITSESDQDEAPKMIMPKKSPKALTNGHKSPNKSKDGDQHEDDDDDDDSGESDIHFYGDSDSDDDGNDDDDGDDDSDDEEEEVSDSDDVDAIEGGPRGRFDQNRLNLNDDFMSDDDDDSDYDEF